jgi:hypothetical protein
MAVGSGVTVVPNAGIACVAFTGLHGDKTVDAMGKTLELEGGKRVLPNQERGRAYKDEKPLLHNILHASVRRMRRIVQRRFLRSRNFSQNLRSTSAPPRGVEFGGAPRARAAIAQSAGANKEQTKNVSCADCASSNERY